LPGQGEEPLEIPRQVPILPLRETVVFPHLPTPLVVGRPGSIQVVDQVLVGDRMLGLVAQKDGTLEVPLGRDLYRIGTVAVIHRMVKLPDGTLRVLVRGLERMRIVQHVQEHPFLQAEIEPLAEVEEEGTRTEALIKNLMNLVQKMMAKLPINAEELSAAFHHTLHPGRLADMVAAVLSQKLVQKQEILETLNVQVRLRKLTRYLSKELEVMDLGSKIQENIQSEIEDHQRKYILREQLKAIKKELGESDDAEAELEELETRLHEAGLPDYALKEAERELGRLRAIPQASAEYPVIRTYLDWLIALPWSKSTEDKLDIKEAQTILDEDHYGLEKIKERILEYLAVRKLKEDMKGPILCFTGPPGTGKTSLGRSIARALGRKFVRMALGGMRDEAEIRGHRRTYVGAMPGRIIQGLRTAGTRNPVFILDEVDKLGQDFRGDPSSALLEVLDPEQNNTFSDHYIDLPFDLSKVFFITTANVLETIPGPLRDRMEVIRLPGYTAREKAGIAENYLLPRQIEAHGLAPEQISVEDELIATVIARYTREAGVRNLERELAALCRKAARQVAEGTAEKVHIAVEELEDYLGPQRHFEETADRTGQPGVVTGLAWTPTGGEILFIEATRMAGHKSLTLTGQLGNVMKESAQTALSLVRSRASVLEIPEDFYNKSDLHIHVPAGAIPKDGPSAGVAMVAALASLLTERPCRPDVAMTGEITLRGLVLPVGGVKEKTLAAHRAGIRTIILPEKNRKDLQDIHEDVQEVMTFVFVKTVDEVLEHAIAEAPADAPKGEPASA
jgi:ATP-dependent Lon protease